MDVIQSQCEDKQPNTRLKVPQRWIDIQHQVADYIATLPEASLDERGISPQLDDSMTMKLESMMRRLYSQDASSSADLFDDLYDALPFTHLPTMSSAEVSHHIRTIYNTRIQGQQQQQQKQQQQRSLDSRQLSKQPLPTLTAVSQQPSSRNQGLEQTPSFIIGGVDISAIPFSIIESLYHHIHSEHTTNRDVTASQAEEDTITSSNSQRHAPPHHPSQPLTQLLPPSLQLINSTDLLTIDQTVLLNATSPHDFYDHTSSGDVSIFAICCISLLDGYTNQLYGHHCSIIRLNAPYIPSFFAFKECPAILAALFHIRLNYPHIFPHVLITDSNGLLHEYNAGLACHVTALTHLPCIGAAKTAYLHHNVTSHFPIDYQPQIPSIYRRYYQQTGDLCDESDCSTNTTRVPVNNSNADNSNANGSHSLDAPTLNNAVYKYLHLVPGFIRPLSTGDNDHEMIQLQRDVVTMCKSFVSLSSPLQDDWKCCHLNVENNDIDDILIYHCAVLLYYWVHSEQQEQQNDILTTSTGMQTHHHDHLSISPHQPHCRRPVSAQALLAWISTIQTAIPHLIPLFQEVYRLLKVVFSSSSPINDNRANRGDDHHHLINGNYPTTALLNGIIHFLPIFPLANVDMILSGPNGSSSPDEDHTIAAMSPIRGVAVDSSLLVRIRQLDILHQKHARRTSAQGEVVIPHITPTNPCYVSIGGNISLYDSIMLVLSFSFHRVVEPIRHADGTSRHITRIFQQYVDKSLYQSLLR